ncbi:hypothetical protein D3875_01240 [Deinococcus cavernae]|uniref:Protein kinase domain-containing protein n=1 Tax=Deinococcus cavernae TaxID=2320857 RepID=A0A418VI22_9DEIO|nr:protein kinase [Deinococcus cavernae]RJF75700.1 hypothetical protein D3875_01240 [Deinococcus cavernae]
MTATLPQYVDQHGRTIHLGKELGRGGQGAVYEVGGQQGLVAKIYLKRPDSATAHKLAALAHASSPELLAVSAWPQSVLKDASGQVHGFAMPLVSDNEYQELHNLYRKMSRQKLFPQADWRFLVHVARNIARAFVVLHSRNHLMGDVSSRNVMVSQNGTVRFIDTDSFQVTVQGQTYPCPVGTAEFTPPELQGKSFGTLVRTVEHDLFGLALLVFHLLFDGRHPYAGVHDNGSMPSPAEAITADKFAYSVRHQHGVKPPPFTLTLQGLHERVRDLFERAFSPSHQGRPTAAEWEHTMAELFSHLTTCQKNSVHKHDKRLPCPWCALLPSNAQAATAKTGIPAGAKRIDVDGELNRIWNFLRTIPVPPPPPAVTVQGSVTPLPLPPLPPLPAAPPEPAMPPLPAGPPLPTLPPLDLSPATPMKEPVPPVRPLAYPPVATERYSVSAVAWGVACWVLALGSLRSGAFLMFIVFVVAGWYNFNKNSSSQRAARRARRQKAFEVLHQKALQNYVNDQRKYEVEIVKYQDYLQNREQNEALRISLMKLERQSLLADLNRQREEKIAESKKQHAEQYAAMLSKHREKIARDKEQQKEAYRLLLIPALREHQQAADKLRQQISQGYGRQQGSSVLSGYKAAVKKLEQQRLEIRDLAAQEQEELDSVIEKHRQPMLDRYLDQYVLNPGDIPGIGPMIIDNMNQRGVFTAKDIDANVRYIKGVGPKKQLELLAWRDTLEQFFQFDPSKVPPRELDAVRQAMDQRRMVKLRQLENAVAQLKTDLQAWQSTEAAISRDLLALKTQLAQREKTIELIRQWQ